MNKPFVQLFIVGYLAVLAFGLAVHTVGWNANAHPAMYFIVWDMYGGSSPFEERRHILAEGASGAYYELNSPPWGEFVPFGSAGRSTYDFSALFTDQFARCTLAHTDHEPIVRLFQVDELWNRKFNLGDRAWSVVHQEPRSRHSYFYLRGAFDNTGAPLSLYTDFYSVLAAKALMNNPQLQGTIARTRPYATIDAMTRPETAVMPAAYYLPPR
jgi:hypothetical protein